MKIVVSGTDSLGFQMANRDELYDRNIMIHTSFIPFREYENLLGIRDAHGVHVRDLRALRTMKWESNDFKSWEVNMVIYDTINNNCSIYEIKHSNKIIKNQARYLLDEEKCNIIKNKYGEITKKVIIYRGKTTKNDDNISYLNVEEYLISLK